MKHINKLLVAGAAVSGAFLMSAPGAKADIITTGFDFNLTHTAGGGVATNVKLLDLGAGSATIVQNVVGGSIFNQTFVETGVIQVTGYVKVGGGAQVALPIAAGTTVYFSYTLNGKVTPGSGGNGDVTFSGGLAKLFFDTDGDLDPTSGAQLLASFNVQPGTGGTNLVNAGGVPSGTFQVSFKEDPSSPFNDLFKQNGAAIDAIAIELANIQPSIDPSVSPNPNVVVDGSGNGTSTIVVTGQGQLLLAVPEPGSLALIGSALLGFGAIVRRRRKTTDA